jgi:hypothetical protein
MGQFQAPLIRGWVNLFSHRDEIMQMESAFSEEDRL